MTFRLRSGVEGLPPLTGATVYVDDRSAVTDRDGVATIADVLAPNPFLIDATGFVPYRGLAESLVTDVTLWPLLPGTTETWLSGGSYYGPDYNSALWRPASDIELDLQGDLATSPYRDIWASAVGQVASAIDSARVGAPTVRLGASAGATPVRLIESVACRPIRWYMEPGILTPPPVIELSNAAKARDAGTVLELVSQLVGLNLGLARRTSPTASPSTLSSLERTAIRMRMLRRPGTTLVGFSEDASGPSAAESTTAYFCL